MDNVMEATLEGLGRDELAGAYRGICGMLLVHTALAFRRKPTTKKQEAMQRNQAREWVRSQVGLITFCEACEVMGMDEERARRDIMAVAYQERSAAINRVVFGVRQNAHHDDASGGGQRGNHSQ